MTTTQAFALGMRRLREKRGLTQAQLAEAANLDEQSVSRFEREKRSPAVTTIDAVARALGVQPWQLLREGSDARGPLPPRDVLLARVRRLVAAWPDSKRERLLTILTELGPFAVAKQRGRPKRP